ncbi:hypothetical protein [Halorientalis brevis]|uniref:hypothetical protein n=1 Tax=Halorientalis brevis TaxID=1126241 RepID=UPI001FF73B84|nr:hypothetical protein [Halorientalis brevis]
MATASFRVRSCSFDARFEYDEFVVDPGRQVPLQIDRTLTEAVSLDVSGIPDGVLARMANGSVTDGGVRVPVPDNGRLSLNVTREFYCGPGAGEYEFTVTSAKSGAARRASVTAASELGAEAVFGTIRTDETRNVVTIPITVAPKRAHCWNESDLVLQLGTDTDGFTVRTGIADANDDGTVLVRVNTSTVGTAPASEFLRAVGNDSLRNPMLLTHRTRPIPEGNYEVKLSADGNELDVGRMLIERNQSTPPQDPTSPTPATESGTTRTEAVMSKPALTATTRPETATRPTTTADGVGFGPVTAILAIALVVLARRGFEST